MTFSEMKKYVYVIADINFVKKKRKDNNNNIIDENK